MKKLFPLLALVLFLSLSFLSAEARKSKMGVGHTFEDVVPGEHVGGNESKLGNI